MPYGTNSSKARRFSIPLPSEDGQYWIMATSRLGNHVKKEVQASGFQPVVNPQSGELEMVLNPALMAYELMCAVLTHPDTYHNLDDAEGRPIALTRHWIGDGFDEGDAEFVQSELMPLFVDQIGLERRADEDARERQEKGLDVTAPLAGALERMRLQRELRQRAYDQQQRQLTETMSALAGMSPAAPRDDARAPSGETVERDGESTRSPVIALPVGESSSRSRTSAMKSSASLSSTER